MNPRSSLVCSRHGIHVPQQASLSSCIGNKLDDMAMFHSTYPIAQLATGAVFPPRRWISLPAMCKMLCAPCWLILIEPPETKGEEIILRGGLIT